MEEDIKIEKEIRKKAINYPPGSKVIIKGNDDNPYQVANLVRWDIITHASGQKTVAPVVKFDDSNLEYYSFGIMRHYMVSRNRALDKLSGREQWNVLAEFNQMKDV